MVTHIQVRTADLCPGNSNFSADLDMIAVSNGWAQVGWINYSALCCIRFFWQWKDVSSNSLPTAYWGTPVLGSEYDFSTVRESSDGKVHLYKDGSAPPCNQQNQCPVTSWKLHKQGSSNGQFFGEVDKPGSDISGNVNAKTHFGVTSELWNGTWASYAWFGLHDDCSYYHHQDTSGSALPIPSSRSGRIPSRTN